MLHSLDPLLARLDALLEALDKAEAEHGDLIDAVAPGHRVGAVNLVHYGALRRHDMRTLQLELRDVGVTSLSTSEAGVRPTVQAARTVVAALRGDAGPWDLDATRRTIAQGDELLRVHSEAVFGPMSPGRPRIMVTFPAEAATDAELVRSFVDAGMDIARINCAHDDRAAWAAMAGHVRDAAAGSGREVTVSMDLPGPKLRTGPILPGPAVGRARVTRDGNGRMIAPARIWVTPRDAPAAAAASAAPAAHPTLALLADREWCAGCRTGDRIVLRDLRGRKRSFTVVTVDASGVLAEGSRNAYVGDATELVRGSAVTGVSGLPRQPRRLSLAAGDLLVLTDDLTAVDPPAGGQVARIGCTLPEAVRAMQPGHAVLLDDGAVTAIVEAVGAGEAVLRVVRTKPGGQRLGAEKGINLPDTVLDLPALTAQDEAQLPFIRDNADMVAVSFIRTAEDIRHVLDRMEAVGADQLGLVLKIETRQGFENLPSILLAAMRNPRVAVMVARGDMAAELGFERLSEVPRQILALCEAAHVPSIWATQVLENLAQTGQPSRAEITDAAAAQRADAVMLNKGPHVVAAIEALAAILVRMGEVQRKSRTLMRHIHSWDAQ